VLWGAVPREGVPPPEAGEKKDAKREMGPQRGTQCTKRDTGPSGKFRSLSSLCCLSCFFSQLLLESLLLTPDSWDRRPHPGGSSCPRHPQGVFELGQVGWRPVNLSIGPAALSPVPEPIRASRQGPPAIDRPRANG